MMNIGQKTMLKQILLKPSKWSLGQCSESMSALSALLGMEICLYRSGTVNSNTVNSKFHLIRSFFEIFAKFLPFHV